MPLIDDPNQPSKFDHWLTPQALNQFHLLLSSLQSPLDTVTDYEAFVLLARRFNPLYPSFLEGPVDGLESRVLNQWDSIVLQPSDTRLSRMRDSVRGACRHISQLELFSANVNRDEWQKKRLGLRIYDASTDPPVKQYLVHGDAIGRLEAHEGFWIITFLFAVAGYKPPVMHMCTPGIFYRPYYSPYTIITEIKYKKPRYLPRNPVRRFCTHLSDLCHHFRNNRFDDTSYLRPITENIHLRSSAGSLDAQQEHLVAPNERLHFSPEDNKVRAKLGTDDESHPAETTLCYFASKIHTLSELQPVECTPALDDIVLTYFQRQNQDLPECFLVAPGRRSMFIPLISPLLLFMSVPFTPKEIPFGPSIFNVSLSCPVAHVQLIR